jgi:glutamate-1-semialdehyde 2,1-aminomutase
MEVMRGVEPSDNFLSKVRKLATENGVVLIFDECTSGFRETFGGLHSKYGVTPDMAVYGKALGNGYAITAIVGKRALMEEAQSTFISSTFWTERIGPTAALKTLEIMERERSWEKITEIGQQVKQRWTELAKKNNLNLTVSGIPALASFNFESEKNLHYKTLITQEMLKAGYLAGTSMYISLAHDQTSLDDYFYSLDKVFRLISNCEDGADINKLLKYPICHSGFKRLN